MKKENVIVGKKYKLARLIKDAGEEIPEFLERYIGRMFTIKRNIARDDNECNIYVEEIVDSFRPNEFDDVEAEWDE